MNRKKFARFLKELKNASKRGEDVDAIMKAHEHENAYIYNDGIFKKIFASEKNIALTTDLVNATLGLSGADRIKKPKIENPFIPGEVGYKSVEPDLLLTNSHGKGMPRDRISIDVQHKGYTLYPDRLLLYVSRHNNDMVPEGKEPNLDNLQVVSFQFFDSFPQSPKYLHKVRLRDEDNLLYFEKLTITIVEVAKFFRHRTMFTKDKSRLAQWLRAIDALNREYDFGAFSQDPVFRVLQKEVKLCRFSARYLMTIDMRDIDKAMWEYEAVLKVAKKMLKNGIDVSLIAKTTDLPKKVILSL